MAILLIWDIGLTIFPLISYLESPVLSLLGNTQALLSVDTHILKSICIIG